ncbi:hypothetical protein ART_3084 [Arthrobacter sp. PAMC 25486]|uniref:ArsR/SmtB family transcription factor n=1 Tax=Arthrobacter sp. PAMC 25486 TaxID=1494608 RepID=UPI000536146A|nr:metalloregulator ArsR/SmtB family transcription factor [Arthrobacter sp. PAMC 25486]AIY02683.1 hypothetical protein ART_3084 [Arthrobacter sp. PAMC 25486]
MVVEKVFAVIAESTRRDILEALAQESKAVGQLVDELGVSQPTVSKHLRVLREAGVVTMRAQGQKRFYGINTEPLAMVATWLESLGAGIDGDGAVAGSVAAAGAAAKKLGAAKAAPADVSGAVGGAGAVKTRQTNPEPKVAQVPAKTAEAAAAVTTVVTPKRESVPAAAPVPVSVGAVPPGTMAVSSAAKPAQSAPARPAATPVVRAAQPNQSVGVDNDGGVPRQLGRSVGRAAKKGADLLATFKRRKD